MCSIKEPEFYFQLYLQVNHAHHRPCLLRWIFKYLNTKRERNTHAAGDIFTFFIFSWTSFLPLFIRRVQGTKRTNQEQRLYTQRSVKTRLSIVRGVCMHVNGVLVWTWVTDYSVCLCECVLCACLNSVRFATNDFCLHKTGFKTWIYIASRMLRWCFDRQRASILKSESANKECCLSYDDSDFRMLARCRSKHHLNILEAMYIHVLKPVLCKQKSFVANLTLFKHAHSTHSHKHTE